MAELITSGFTAPSQQTLTIQMQPFNVQYNVGFYLLTFGDRHFLFILPTKCHLVQSDKVYKAAEIEKPHVVTSHSPSPSCYYTRAFQMKV